jgi:hypothetical protein
MGGKGVNKSDANGGKVRGAEVGKGPGVLRRRFQGPDEKTRLANEPLRQTF